MQARHLATWMLEQEARALLTRLDRVKPFALQETMLPAAALSPAAQTGIEQYLMRGRRDLRGRSYEWSGLPRRRRRGARNRHICPGGRHRPGFPGWRPVWPG